MGRLDGVQGVDPGFGSDRDQFSSDGRVLVRTTVGHQVHQRMGDGIGPARCISGRDQPKLNIAEKVGQPFFAGVAGIMPGAAMPEAGFTGGHLGIPLIPRRADVVLAGHTHGHSVGEELVELLHGIAAEDELAGICVEHFPTERQIELPVVPAPGHTWIPAIAGIHQACILHLLGVSQYIVQGVLTGLDVGRQRLDIGVGVTDPLHVWNPGEKGARLRILRNPINHAVKARDLDQIFVKVIQWPRIEVHVVLDRANQTGLRPGCDILMTGHHDVRCIPGFGRQRHSLLEPFPAIEIVLRLDGDVQFLAEDCTFTFQNVSSHHYGVDPIGVIDVRTTCPDLHGEVLSSRWESRQPHH